MELTFPFKNLTFNNFYSYFDKKYYKNFCEIQSGKIEHENSTIESHTIFFENTIPNFENEALQIINTSNQATIDHYFNSIEESSNHIKTLLTNESLNKFIIDWNNEYYDSYIDEVDRKSAEYFNNPNRTKYKHLERYKSYLPNFGIGALINQGNLTSTDIINYNFFCIDFKPTILDDKYLDKYLKFIQKQFNKVLITIAENLKNWRKDLLIEKTDKQISLKPIVFFEGDIDIVLVRKAADLLNKTSLLDKVELRQRGSCSNLDKLWNILIEDNWETNPQKKLLIYDCETNRPDNTEGHIVRKTIPMIKENIIKRGIENLLPNDIVNKAIEHKKAFIDFNKTEGTKRGKPFITHNNVVNKDEKRNFCNWICANASKKDFTNFSVIFEMIEKEL